VIVRRVVAQRDNREQALTQGDQRRQEHTVVFGAGTGSGYTYHPTQPLSPMSPMSPVSDSYEYGRSLEDEKNAMAASTSGWEKKQNPFMKFLRKLRCW
jgi:hypothetical protein